MGATKNAKRQYKGIFNRCRKKNFSHVAKALSLTQPAVSFQIQTLEQY